MQNTVQSTVTSIIIWAEGLFQEQGPGKVSPTAPRRRAAGGVHRCSMHRASSVVPGVYPGGRGWVPMGAMGTIAAWAWVRG